MPDHRKILEGVREALELAADSIRQTYQGDLTKHGTYIKTHKAIAALDGRLAEPVDIGQPDECISCKIGILGGHTCPACTPDVRSVGTTPPPVANDAVEQVIKLIVGYEVVQRSSGRAVMRREGFPVGGDITEESVLPYVLQMKEVRDLQAAMQPAAVELWRVREAIVKVLPNCQYEDGFAKSDNTHCEQIMKAIGPFLRNHPTPDWQKMREEVELLKTKDGLGIVIPCDWNSGIDAVLAVFKQVLEGK